MSELKPCQTADVEDAIGYMKQMRLLCDTDDGFVPQVYDLAIDALRRSQPSNEPLTLDELREEKGQVWICYPQETWGPQKADAKGLHSSAYTFPFDTYGKTWLAYRRPPEKEANDGQH